MPVGVPASVDHVAWGGLASRIEQGGWWRITCLATLVWKTCPRAAVVLVAEHDEIHLRLLDALQGYLGAGVT